VLIVLSGFFCCWIGVLQLTALGFRYLPYKEGTSSKGMFATAATVVVRAVCVCPPSALSLHSAIVLRAMQGLFV